MDRDLADRAHVDEQVFRHFSEQHAAAHSDNRLMKGDVRIRVFGELFAVLSSVGAVAEAVHEPARYVRFDRDAMASGRVPHHARVPIQIRDEPAIGV